MIADYVISRRRLDPCFLGSNFHVNFSLLPEDKVPLVMVFADLVIKIPSFSVVGLQLAFERLFESHE